MKVKSDEERLNEPVLSFRNCLRLAIVCWMALYFAMAARHATSAVSFLQMMSHWFDALSDPADYASLRWTSFGAFITGAFLVVMFYFGVTLRAPWPVSESTRTRLFYGIAVVMVGATVVLCWPYLVAHVEFEWAAIKSDGFFASREVDRRFRCVLITTMVNIMLFHIALEPDVFGKSNDKTTR